MNIIFIIRWSESHSVMSVPSPGDLPNPGIEPRFPALQADSLPAKPQGSSRILEWVAYPFFNGSSQPKNQTRVSCNGGKFFTNWAIRETGILIKSENQFVALIQVSNLSNKDI